MFRRSRPATARLVTRVIRLTAVLWLASAAPVFAQDRARLVPESVTPAAIVTEAIDADWLTDAERSALRIRHGLWSPEDLDRVEGGFARAAAAIGRWDLVADDASSPAAWRIDALVRVGRAPEAVALAATLDEAERGAATVLAPLAAAQLATGDPETAIETADRAIAVADDDEIEDGLAAVAAMRTRLAAGGGSPRDFETMLDRLADLRSRVDRIDARPRLLEGMLLVERGNTGEGVPALHESLARDPRRAEAWRMLGLIAVRSFDFDGGERAAAVLGRLAGLVPGDAIAADATILRARAALVRKDPDLAATLLDDLLAAIPTHPEALALRAATAAVRYDASEEIDWLARLDEVEPGSPVGWYEVGAALSFDRQYDVAAEALAEAIRRRPNWPEPHVELGLLEMQAARDDRARVALDTAVELDPYHKRAAFSRFLLEELDAFTVTESEHFILKHRPGADEVVASGMLGPLEAMHADLVERFRHEPDRKTVIELMPDHEFFAVRITGMPQIHTIAACTGPLIAIEVPKDTNPRKHLGLFDWLRVLRHEYAHTITLSQTRNRIPHWLTEAAATSIEGVPRRYDTCGQLAARWRKGELFDLDEISFAFIRPKKPGDRGMAYAQGAWMVEFMNERWGEQALVDLMALYADGVREEDAIPQTLGIERDAFHAAFLAWAGEQVADWGLDPQPSLDELADEVRLADPAQRAALRDATRERLARIAAGITAEIGAPRTASDTSDGGPSNAEVWPDLGRPPVELDDATLATLLETHRDHPDLLELVLRRRLRSDATITPEVEDLLARYAAARPVDPYPHRILARHFLDGDDPVRAIPHLVELDLRSVKDPSFALEIARLGRVAADREIAFDAAERAARMNPYDPATRELAAACAIEATRYDDARRHIHALTILEPDEPRHAKRLRAVERLVGAG